MKVGEESEGGREEGMEGVWHVREIAIDIAAVFAY